MGKNFKNYTDGLSQLNLKTLSNRRDEMCLNFAKKCLKNDKVKKFFSKKGKSHVMKKRGQELYKIKMIKTKGTKNQLFHIWRDCSILIMKKEVK